MITFPAVEAFDEVTVASSVTESIALPRLTKLWVRTAVAESPNVIESDDASIASVCDVTTALDGTTERPPNPKAAIAVTAIRLKNVIFDISFLSIVAVGTFPIAAGKEHFFAL